MSPYLETGRTGAAAIWNPITTTLLENKPAETFIIPQGLVAVTICNLNNLLTCENCPYVRTEYFTKGTEPKRTCLITLEEKEKILHPKIGVDN